MTITEIDIQRLLYKREIASIIAKEALPKNFICVNNDVERSLLLPKTLSKEFTDELFELKKKHELP